MAFAKYMVLRIAVFAVCFGVLYAVGIRNTWVAALIAILVSGAISLILLDRVRNEAGLSLEAKGNPIARLQERVQAATTAEDAADDAARAARNADEAGDAGPADAARPPDQNGLRSPE
jgi:hypothetical protein